MDSSPKGTFPVSQDSSVVYLLAWFSRLEETQEVICFSPSCLLGV